MPIEDLVKIINKKTGMFQVDSILHYDERELRLINLLKRHQRIRQEQEDKKKAIEFLNQLP